MESPRKGSPWDLSIQQQMPHSQKSFQAHNGFPASPLTRLLITWHTIAWCPPTLVGTRHCKDPTPTVLTRNPSIEHRFLHVGKYSSRHALIPATTTIGTFGKLEAPNSATHFYAPNWAAAELVQMNTKWACSKNLVKMNRNELVPKAETVASYLSVRQKVTVNTRYPLWTALWKQPL